MRVALAEADAAAAIGEVPVGCVIVGADGRVLHLNPAAEELFDRSRERAAGLPAREDEKVAKERLALFAQRDKGKLPAEAISAHSRGDFPSRRPQMNPASKQSPAPVGSTSFTGYAGTSVLLPLS